jgi:hypothetical protein
MASYPRPYSQVAQALQNLGGSVQQGFKDVGQAGLTAAEFDLKSAKLNHEIKKEEMLFPGLTLARDNANRELEQQKELDKPLGMSDVTHLTFGNNPDDYDLIHYTANNMFGDFLNATGASYDMENDNVIGSSGKTLTVRDFVKAAPLYQSVILAKTDPIKKAQDELDKARDGLRSTDMRTRGLANNEIVRLKEFMGNTKAQLDAYDKQEQLLIGQKARFSQLPKGSVDLTYIDDSIDRIRRKRDEIISTDKFNKEIAAKLTEKGDAGPTDKQIGDWRMEIQKRVDEEYAIRGDEGGNSFPVRTTKDENGKTIYLGPYGKPIQLTPEQLDMVRGKGSIRKAISVPMTERQIDAAKTYRVHQLLTEQMQALGFLRKGEQPPTQSSRGSFVNPIEKTKIPPPGTLKKATRPPVVRTPENAPIANMEEGLLKDLLNAGPLMDNEDLTWRGLLNYKGSKKFQRNKVK